MLACGADPNALRSAAWHADPQWLDLCLARGGKPDRALEKGRPVLHELVRWGRIDNALRLLERGASPNVADERGWTALHQAVSRGNARMVEALLAAGADRDARDASHLTASDYSRVLRKPKLVELLASRAD